MYCIRVLINMKSLQGIFFNQNTKYLKKGRSPRRCKVTVFYDIDDKSSFLHLALLSTITIKKKRTRWVQ